MTEIQSQELLGILWLMLACQVRPPGRGIFMAIGFLTLLQVALMWLQHWWGGS